jgi:hypothetical protein
VGGHTRPSRSVRASTCSRGPAAHGGCTGESEVTSSYWVRTWKAGMWERGSGWAGSAVRAATVVIAGGATPSPAKTFTAPLASPRRRLRHPHAGARLGGGPRTGVPGPGGVRAPSLCRHHHLQRALELRRQARRPGGDRWSRRIGHLGIQFAARADSAVFATLINQRVVHHTMSLSGTTRRAIACGIPNPQMSP